MHVAVATRRRRRRADPSGSWGFAPGLARRRVAMMSESDLILLPLSIPDAELVER